MGFTIEWNNMNEVIGLGPQFIFILFLFHKGITLLRVMFYSHTWVLKPWGSGIFNYITAAHTMVTTHRIRFLYSQPCWHTTPCFAVLGKTYMEGNGFEECVFLKCLEACISKQSFCLSKTGKLSLVWKYFVVKKLYNVPWWRETNQEGTFSGRKMNHASGPDLLAGSEGILICAVLCCMSCWMNLLCILQLCSPLLIFGAIPFSSLAHWC